MADEDTFWEAECLACNGLIFKGEPHECRGEPRWDGRRVRSVWFQCECGERYSSFRWVRNAHLCVACVEAVRQEQKAEARALKTYH